MSPPHGICEYWYVLDPPQLMRSLKLLNTWNSQAIKADSFVNIMICGNIKNIDGRLPFNSK